MKSLLTKKLAKNAIRLKDQNQGLFLLHFLPWLPSFFFVFVKIDFTEFALFSFLDQSHSVLHTHTYSWHTDRIFPTWHWRPERRDSYLGHHNKFPYQSPRGQSTRRMSLRSHYKRSYFAWSCGTPVKKFIQVKKITKFNITLCTK